MNNQESLDFIHEYFNELFVKHNVAALDAYLDKDYFDDDIGDPDVDHIANSKAYLRAMFIQKPTVGVDVIDAITRDGVITAFLNWFVVENGVKQVTMKGIGIFVMNGDKILKRHTYLYEKA